MPSRKKPSTVEAKAATQKSLDEWGVKRDRYSKFSRSILELVVNLVVEKHTPVAINQDCVKLPESRDQAIQAVLVSDLRDYLDPKKFIQRATEIDDCLYDLLLPDDRKTSIISWPPNFVIATNRDGIPKILKKRWFKRFSADLLDPFRRFSFTMTDLPPAEVAYIQGTQESQLITKSFEAIVASHAIHHEACFRCNKRNTLLWSGGSDTSWRDIYCSSCQSCFEVKSKADKLAIDRIFKYDRFLGGSFRRWCKEDFADRTVGSDFIVFVNRTPTLHPDNKQKSVWNVEIAEIGMALPSLRGRAFEGDDERYIDVKTIVTLRNRCTWFRIPICENNTNLTEIFHRAFETVFPDDYNKLEESELAKMCVLPGSAVNLEFPPVVPSIEAIVSDIDILKRSLQELAVEDWEDLADDCD